MVLLEIALAIVIALAIFLFVKNMQWKMRFDQRVREFLESREEGIRRDAISHSARTLSGKTLEKLVPFLNRFGHDPHDVRWIGDPVDLVVFDGYSESGRRSVDGVTFVEVKSGSSELHTGQKSVRGAIEKRRVRWEEFRI